MTRWPAIFVLTAVFSAILSHWAHAAEGWQGRPLVCDPAEYNERVLAECKDWISTAPMPDGNSRCCGEGDAYVADTFEVAQDGSFIAVISRDYPGNSVDDGEGGTVAMNAVPKGTRVPIPKEKVNPAYRQKGNPTGHGIVFMNSGGQVYCYFAPTLI